MKRIFLFLCGAMLWTAIFAAAPAFSQNLLDNADYQKAVQLRDQAQQALNDGQYDKATQLSQQAQEYAQKAVDLAKEMALAYRATNWLGLAKDRVAYAQSLDVATRYPVPWSTAQTRMTAAQSTYDGKEYQKSIAASQAVVAALKDVKPAPSVAALPVSEPRTVAQAKLPEPPLPEYYVVRLIPDRRDSFWRIAGYPFIYGDPLRWPLIYQANKQILQDPNNPNLIQPGMVFKIPSINGEKRSGTYRIQSVANPQPATVAQPAASAQSSAAASTKAATLPEYYIVRSIPGHSDCFWQIAGYSFVYGDPTKWTLIYDANKQALQDPNNPNLIQPGMKFRIPPIHGEQRSGTYQPRRRGNS